MGTAGNSGDGGAATSAQLSGPYGVAVDGNRNVYIADPGNCNIRMVNNAGIITTFAGTGTAGNSGDGGAANSAQLSSPWGVATDSGGNVYMADPGNYKIRMVYTVGIIITFAGTGFVGSYGDGGAATYAQLGDIWGVAADSNGNVYFADRVSSTIRRVSSTGIITTFAGTGIGGSSGDGGKANKAQLYGPYGVAMDSSGNVYIADSINNKIRMVNSAGIITTFAGTGAVGYGGDGGAATSAQLYWPRGVAVDSNGNVLVIDAGNDKIRVVTGNPVCPAGYYMSGSMCLLCAAGTYNPTIGTASACLTCPVSLLSQSGASQCTTAPPTCAPTPSPSYVPGAPTPAPTPIPTSAPSYTPGSPTPLPTVGAPVTVHCTQVLINASAISQNLFFDIFESPKYHSYFA